MPATRHSISPLRRFVIAGLAVLAIGATTVSCRVPQRYDVSEVVVGLNRPWDIAFLGDGTMFVTERDGISGDYIGVKLPGQQYRRFDNVPSDVQPSGEGGMMGLAIDPNFHQPGNQRIYACYLTSSDVRVVRFRVTAGYAGLTDQTPLVTGIPRSSGRHSGCRLEFKPGTSVLWITTGDAADCNNPQNPRSLAGKVLRVNTDGSPAAGNIGGNFLPQIYAYGFRNPQGLAFRSDGTPLLVEHGPDRDDEITPLPISTPGGNGGWAPGCGYNEGVPMTDTNRFPNALRPFWQSGFPTIAPSGAAIVTDADWGDRRGQLAVAVLKGQQLRMFNVGDGSTDGGGAVVSGYGRLRTAVEGPDGRLYLATDSSSGRILAVQPVL